MTKRERLAATIARQPVDRPAVSLWRHVPELDHDPRRLADAMLAFQARWDLDFIKVMPSGVYCVEDWGCTVAYRDSPNGAKQCIEHAVKTADDWRRLAPLDPGAGALGRELEAVHRIARGRDEDVPVLHTLFSPLSVARKLAGDRLARDLRERPEAVRAGLETITATLVRYATTAFEAGADGIFFATQTATPHVLGEPEFAEWDLPYARRVLESAQGRSCLTLLHAHGQDVFFDRLAALPAHAINWHDRVTRPSLVEGRERFPGAVAGGIDEWRTLRKGPPEAVAEEVRDGVRRTDGVGLIVAPGCVLPLDAPDEHLAAAVAAAKSPRRR
jgi:uroporphyrinogen decarboxylase